MDVALFFCLIPPQILATTIFFFLPFLAMALPQLPQIFFPYFGNDIATNQLQQFFFSSISTMPLPKILLTIFFFLEMICTHNFYNIFTTNFKWQVVIFGLKSNLNIKFKFELIITNHLRFVVKML